MEPQNKQTIINSIRAVSFNITDFIRKLCEEGIFPAWKENTNKIVNSINSKENINPKEITNPISSKLDEIKNAIKDKDFPEYPEQIDTRANIDKGTEAIQSLSNKLDKLDPKVTINTDLGPIIKLLEESKDETQLLEKLDEIKEKFTDSNDYTKLLEEISNKIKPVDNSNIEELLSKISDNGSLEAVIEYLRAILEKPLPSLEKFTSKDGKRIKVEVDRAGGGGTAGTYNTRNEQINPATEEKQTTGNDFLQSIDGKDFATETTLDEIKDFFTNIYNSLTNWLAVKVLNFPNDYSTSANQTNGNQKVQLIDSDGNNLVTEDNILRIHDTPHSAPELSVHLTQDTATQSTLSVQANKGSRDIVLVDATGFAINNRIKIIDGANGENDILKVLAVNGNTLTLDRVLDADQTAGRVVKKVLINMAVDGSTTEQIFSYKPRTGENKRITGINIAIVTPTEPSPEKFGGITALTRGVHMRVKNASGRNQTYFIPFRSNSSFELSDFDYIKELKVGGGEYTTFLKSNFFQKMRSIIPLNDTQEFQIIIQDNLGTGITSFECKLSMYDESGVVI